MSVTAGAPPLFTCEWGRGQARGYNTPVTPYADTLAWLYQFSDYEVTPLAAASAARLQLRPLRHLLARLGDPQQGRRSIHITGSKGKGSTAAMIASILAAAGERVGLYTSPHLHSERERIRVDGEPVSEAHFVALVEQVRPHAEAVMAAGERLTTFDLRTALGFLAFNQGAVAWQVIEVGLGGRLDSTNVLDQKDCCVFTPISLEHTQILGSTAAEIAADKAGILRPGARAVMAPQRESAADVLRERCAALDVPLEEVAAACALTVDRADLDGQTFRLKTPRAAYKLTLPLLGRHQVENAATAVLAVENCPAAGVAVDAPAMQRGLAEVRWPGRLEVIKRRPLIVLDGAHNADSARRLAQALRGTFSARRTVLVVGMNADKNLPAFTRTLVDGLGEIDVIATRAAIRRAVPARAVADAFNEAGALARTAPTVAAAVDEALATVGDADLVCVTGSLYVVAEARAWLLGILPDGAGEGVGAPPPVPPRLHADREE